MFIYLDNEQIKQEVKKLLIEENITAKSICEKLNITPQRYQKIMNKKNLSFSDISMICNALDYNLSIDFVKKS